MKGFNKICYRGISCTGAAAGASFNNGSDTVLEKDTVLENIKENIKVLDFNNIIDMANDSMINNSLHMNKVVESKDLVIYNNCFIFVVLRVINFMQFIEKNKI